MRSSASNRSAPVLLLLFALLLSSCHVRINPLLKRIDELRLAGIKVYSGEELSESEKETLVEEFHTVDVSFFRVQERRDALLKLYRRRLKAGYYDDDDNFYDGSTGSFIPPPDPEYLRRGNARRGRD